MVTNSSRDAGAAVSRPARVGLRQLTFAYRRGAVVLDELDVDFLPGVNVLLGSNGAGKSTLLQLLTGALVPGRGAVLVDERSEALPVSLFGFMPQDPTLPGHLAVSEVVSYAAWLKGKPYRAARRLAGDALEAVDLGEHAFTRVGRLSGGTRHRVAIACAIVHRPAVLVLDEPLNGLDPEQRAGFRDLLIDLARDRTVVLSTHILQDLLQLGGLVHVLTGGRVRYSGTATDLVRDYGRDGEDLVSALERAFAAIVFAGRRGEGTDD